VRAGGIGIEVIRGAEELVGAERPHRDRFVLGGDRRGGRVGGDGDGRRAPRMIGGGRSEDFGARGGMDFERNHFISLYERFCSGGLSS